MRSTVRGANFDETDPFLSIASIMVPLVLPMTLSAQSVCQRIVLTNVSAGKYESFHLLTCYALDGVFVSNTKGSVVHHRRSSRVIFKHVFLRLCSTEMNNDRDTRNDSKHKNSSFCPL